MLTINLEDHEVNFLMDFVRKGHKSAERANQSTYPTPGKPTKNGYRDSENIRCF